MARVVLYGLHRAIGVLDAYAYRPMVWELFVPRVGAALRGQPADEAVIAAAVPKVRTALSALADLLGGAACFGGESLSLADLHAYPMLAYLGLAAEGDAALRQHPTLVDWRMRMSRRPSAIRTMTRYERPAQPTCRDS